METGKAKHIRAKADAQALELQSINSSSVLVQYEETAGLFANAKQIIDSGRNAAYQSVNAAMLSTYWNLGKRIVVEEQRGQKRAKYSLKIIQQLSDKLTEAYGKGFSIRSLCQYRQFYSNFTDAAKWRICAPFLTWSHLRSLWGRGTIIMIGIIPNLPLQGVSL